MFDRYDIRNEQDLRDAAAQLASVRDKRAKARVKGTEGPKSAFLGRFASRVRLYEEGGGTHGLGYDPSLPFEDDSDRVPITKRDLAWEKIKARAEAIQKSGNGGRGMPFAVAVDQVLRTEEGAQLYNEYRGG
jgi:hypothetical protein